MTETVGSAIPKSSVQDLFGVTEKERFEAELEFVQGLASPQYLNWLAQNRYFEDPALVEYLSYLQYWKQPEYARFLQYPHCLHFLDLLQSKEFRLNMASNHAKVLFSQDKSLANTFSTELQILSALEQRILAVRKQAVRTHGRDCLQDQIHAQQLYFYQHYRNNRLKQQEPSSSK